MSALATAPLGGGYVLGWCALCLVAVVVAVRSVRVSVRDAIAFLAVPWKLAIIVPAVLFVTFAGHFTNDPTWDLVNGGGMALLTVGTAWWSLGTIARALRRKATLAAAFVAVVLTLFSSSWFYDGWLLLRDGTYTRQWLSNLSISPSIYLSCGALLNLELRGPDARLAMAFTRDPWPSPGSRAMRPALLLAMVPLVIIAAYLLAGAVEWHSR